MESYEVKEYISSQGLPGHDVVEVGRSRSR